MGKHRNPSGRWDCEPKHLKLQGRQNKEVSTKEEEPPQGPELKKSQR